MWGDISLRFWFVFSQWLLMSIIFSYICWLFIYLLWKKCLFRSFTHFLIGFFFPLSNCMSFSYVLDINPLCDIWPADIFFHFLGSLFILLIVSFAMQKPFNLIQTHLVIFAVVACALNPKNHWQDQCQGAFPCVFFEEFYDFKS